MAVPLDQGISDGEYMIKSLDKCPSDNAIRQKVLSGSVLRINSWVKVFRIFPEFRILRLTFHRKSATKC